MRRQIHNFCHTPGEREFAPTPPSYTSRKDRFARFSAASGRIAGLNSFGGLAAESLYSALAPLPT
ncbi:hypothetical protein Hsw_2712 [Hymenobacter swuensis DY53]|uniref:Uncharacterized protein n=1 Tax=Hymenobacter swuensis DY53 TaxID=1227739 RepID=W8F2R1_9BACT|nr:hypothetical protein Hsw_2712 [Hymenobacter swuensis DY53]